MSFETGLGMEPFAGRRHVLRHVKAEFVRHEPVRHLLIAAASPTA
ncbi:DNA mismatch repair protein MutT (plasmid) [Agrobacterium sp. 33MFTa1.1]|nr:DNA mismatch repair protein MutT [Agrobacterium sp. 33MFTa1.1]